MARSDELQSVILPHEYQYVQNCPITNPSEVAAGTTTPKWQYQKNISQLKCRGNERSANTTIHLSKSTKWRWNTQTRVTATMVSANRKMLAIDNSKGAVVARPWRRRDIRKFGDQQNRTINP